MGKDGWCVNPGMRPIQKCSLQENPHWGQKKRQSAAQITFSHTEKNQCWVNNLALWRINMWKIKNFQFAYLAVKIIESEWDLFPTLRVNSYIVLPEAVTHLPFQSGILQYLYTQRQGPQQACKIKTGNEEEELPIQASAWLDGHRYRNLGGRKRKRAIET